MLDTGPLQSGMTADDALHKAFPASQSHGHVQPHPLGHKARCGGPALCSQCQRERDFLAGLGQ
ncbi:hypothetical protein D7S86_27380 [Pararobbsia silviterrae]|uniref:Uncharacterized protein n=1 Tax=Pararobbsia silviterrae TaxID=1792498 RepID=A0A494X8P0_9BURK|nr:hypothetical protein D7S86_27380 [Pararobbsia silviterrae]